MKGVAFLLVFFSFFRYLAQEICPILPSPVTFVSDPNHRDSLRIKKFEFNVSGLPNTLRTILPEIAACYFKQHDTLISINEQNGFISFQPLTGAYPESYSISINPTSIRISYTSESSCFYALQSLFQLTTQNDEKLCLPICFVKDYPAFKWRGLHLDVARHFFTVSEVKRFIDLMAMYKFNIFHWHLTDDQGWRIEIKRYPELTKIGAWRDSTIRNHYSTSPRTWDTDRYGGYYTQEQIKEVVAYAAARQVTIVPEIEMPGHARAALAAYPQFSCTGITQPVPGVWGVFDDVFCAKDSTIEFLQNILDEVITLFPGPFIHIGGDEVPKQRWKKCNQCQSIIKNNGLKDEHELQSYFIEKMDRYLSARNKKLIGWDEILEGGLSPNACVMSWRGMDGGIAATKQKHFVVMTPGSHCYFDHYQGKSASEPLAIGGYTPLEKVYTFNPIPSELNDLESSYILGGQGNLWTEYISNFNQLTYMTYPRAIALSQTLWSRNKPPYSAFEKILKQYHIPRLSGPNLNTHVSLTFMKPTMKFEREQNGISLQFEFKDTNESVVVNFPTREEGIWLSQGKKLPFNRPQKKSIQREFTYFSPCCSDSLTIIEHQGLGASVTYITLPNSRYNSGDLTLVDGQFGARPWRAYQWVGFDTNIIEIQIDLDAKTKISALELGFLNEPSSWIHLPESVIITSDHKKPLTLDVHDEHTIFKFRRRTKMIHLSIHGNPKISEGFPGAGNKPWVFMDEIIIR